MKTKAVIAALILMIGVVQAKASEGRHTLRITHQEGSSVFLVNYLNSQTEIVRITIKDNLGRVLTKKSIKSVKGFLLPVNLEGVDEGVYTIEVENESGKQIQTIEYLNQTPVPYTHVLPLGDNRYLLSIALTGTKKIYIRILDDAQNPVFEQEQLIEGSFARVYDLKNFTGAPSFEVADPLGRSIIIQ